MAGFKNPDVIFVSGGKFQEGWQGTLDHYIRDYGGSAERRGHLHFYNMKVDVLAPDAAMLIGQYRLERGPRVTEGVNTRLFRKVHGRWLITMNHVSAYDVTLFDRSRSALRSCFQNFAQVWVPWPWVRRSPGPDGTAPSAFASAPAAARRGCAG